MIFFLGLFRQLSVYLSFRIEYSKTTLLRTGDVLHHIDLIYAVSVKTGATKKMRTIRYTRHLRFAMIFLTQLAFLVIT
jgi:hypothetical protein